MGKGKLLKFEENNSFDFLFQPNAQKMYEEDFYLKGKWGSDFFKNDNPIVLEVACGKGEYTTGMAQLFPDKNFIGVDFKGARLWRGCKTRVEKNLTNVAFIRNKIEFLKSFFCENEISEIWVTFPDPQKEKDRKKLISERFLNMYKTLLKDNGSIFLKTDSKHLYDYTQRLIKLNDINPILASEDIYAEGIADKCYNIQTHYEKLFLKEGKKITLTEFKLDKEKVYINPPHIPNPKQPRRRRRRK